MRLRLPASLTPEQRAALAEAKRRGLTLPFSVEIPPESAPLSFVDFVKLVKPRFRWYRHNVEVARVLQRVADGELTRVMFFWPPRHGKTEQISRLFSAYYLYRFPHRWVGLNSYAADLAHGLSFEAQANFLAGGGKVHPRASARNYWRTMHGGGMWASGVGGPITGKGFHLGIIDDPLKNAEEAASDTIRAKQKEWYQSTFYTRGEPGEAIIVILTRWHEDDLAGWQMQEERNSIAEGDDGVPEKWYIVNFQAVRDFDDEAEFPETCTVHPDWRRHGEALCPERYPLDKLVRIAKRVGSYFWAALFQQKPSPRGGGILKSEWFYRLHESMIPVMMNVVGGVDLAFTKKTSADYTVCFPLGVDVNGRYYLFRPMRIQAEVSIAIRSIASRCQETGISMLGVESVAAQAAYIQLLIELPEMRGTAITPIKADIDKESRARGWAPIAEQGLITLVTDGTGWEEVFIKEATDFPRGRNDDQVDAVGIALAVIRSLAGGAPASGKSESFDTFKRGLR